MQAPLVTGYRSNKDQSILDFSRRANARKTAEGTQVVIATSDLRSRDGKPHAIAAPNGRSGRGGMNGIGFGAHGSPGACGQDGFDGKPGEHGASASDALLYISGSGGDDVTVWRSDEQRTVPARISANGIILVDARGGDAAPGQRGGAGGRGGRGGDGAPGKDAAPATSGRGNDGQRGGSGGCGGSGGRAGRGGAGGDGGSGSSICITADEQQAALFWLLEADVRKGFGAPGGDAGSPGPGGSGGSGGGGGAGSRGARRDDGSSYPNGNRGHTGSSGRSGNRGATSSDGQAGRDGRPGSIRWQVTRNGHVIASANDRFNASVESFTVFDDNGDGVFEPGSELLIRDMVWRNTGDLHFPGGALVTFQPDDSTISDQSYHVCPHVNAGDAYAVPHQFRMRLEDAGEPQHNKPYRREMHVSSRVSLLNRPFPHASVQSAPVVVEWPVRVEEIVGVDWLGAGEIARMVVRVRNVANRPYGGFHSDASAGKVELRLTVDPLLFVLPTDPASLAYGQVASYSIIDGGHAACILLPEIPAASTMDVVITVQMSAEAGSKLFCKLPLRYDLLLRDRCIEYYSRTMRVTPIYVANTASDALLVTCDKLSRKTFLAWSYMFQMLGLSVQFWDIQRYNGFAAGDVSWAGSVRLVVIPSYRLGEDAVNSNANTHSNMGATGPAPTEVLDFLRLSEVTQHMKGFVETNGSKAHPDAFPLRNAMGADQALVILGGAPDRAASRLFYDLCQPLKGVLGRSIGNGGNGKRVSPETSSAPREVPLLGPAPKLGEDELTADDGYKASYKVSGGGFCCYFCAICSDGCSSDPEIVFKAAQRGIAEKDPSRVYLLAHQESAADKILDVGCFSSESCEVSVYPCLYGKTAGIAAVPEPDLDGGWVPYTFDEVTFTSLQEAWQPGPFMDAFVAIFHTLPIEHRIMTLANNYLARLQFNLPLCGVVGMNAVVLASLTRTIQAEYDSGDAALPLANRLAAACFEHPDWVKRDIHLVISALRGPGIDGDSELGGKLSALAQKIAQFFADRIDSPASVILQHARLMRPSPMRCADDDVYVKVMSLSPSFALLWSPCEQTSMDSKFGKSYGAPLNIGTHVRTFDAAHADEQATSWFYSDNYAVQRLQRKQQAAAAAEAEMRAAAAAHAHAMAAAAAQASQWQNYAPPPPQWAAQLPPDFVRLEAPAPPPDTVTFTEVNFGAPPVFEDEKAVQELKVGPPAYSAVEEPAVATQIGEATAQFSESNLATLSQTALSQAAQAPPPAFDEAEDAEERRRHFEGLTYAAQQEAAVSPSDDDDYDGAGFGSEDNGGDQ